jgi:hypothetical protein
MSKADMHQRLDRVNEITLSVKGRKSDRDIPRPVWFVHEGKTLYLLPVQGSDTNWYKNVLVDPTLKISVNGVQQILATCKLITDSSRVGDIVRKFKSKYREGEVKKYYTKFDEQLKSRSDRILIVQQL